MTVALVLGGAECLFKDLKAAEQLFKPDTIVAVKDIGITYPRVDHWVTYHPERVTNEIRQRRALGYRDPCLWTYDTFRLDPFTKDNWGGLQIRRVDRRGGSSGFMGMVVGVTVADKCVLAGIPMDPNLKHYRRPKPQGWKEAMMYRKVWSDAFEEYQHLVRSMSGWTRELFGAPTREWLDAPSQKPPARVLPFQAKRRV